MCCPSSSPRQDFSYSRCQQTPHYSLILRHSLGLLFILAWWKRNAFAFFPTSAVSGMDERRRFVSRQIRDRSYHKQKHRQPSQELLSSRHSIPELRAVQPAPQGRKRLQQPVEPTRAHLRAAGTGRRLLGGTAPAWRSGPGSDPPRGAAPAEPPGRRGEARPLWARAGVR